MNERKCSRRDKIGLQRPINVLVISLTRAMEGTCEHRAKMAGGTSLDLTGQVEFRCEQSEGVCRRHGKRPGEGP